VYNKEESRKNPKKKRQRHCETGVDNSQTASTATDQTLSAQTINMALVPTVPLSESPLFAEVDMDSDSSAPTVRASVVQATTVFYDTPATLGT
jgi:beta-cyano-L-alanine hydratase/nitrilase